MNICIISHGVHRHTQLLAEGLANRGFKVVLVYFTAKHIFKPRRKFLCVSIPSNSKLTIYSRLISFRKVHKKLKENIHALIYVGYPVAHLLPVYFSKSIKIFMPITGPYNVQRNIKSIYYLPYSYMIKYALKKANLLVTISKFMKNVYYKVYKRKSLVIPPPVDETLFKPNFKLKKDNLILHVARFVPRKGQILAIQMFKKLKKVHGFKNIKLILAGLYSKEKYFMRVLGEAKKVEGVTVLTNVSDEELVKLYQSSTVFWWPIIGCEPFGMPPVEAMACGTPVVSFNKPAANEIISDGVSGFLANNENDFIERTISLLVDKKLRRKIQENAINASKKYFTVNISRVWEKVLRNLYSYKDYYN